MVLFSLYFRLAAMLLVVVGVGTGATMALSQDDNRVSPECELGILFQARDGLRESSPTTIGLYWIQSDGLGLEQIVNYADLPGVTSSSRVHAELSPDGRRLLYAFASYLSDSYSYGFSLLDLSTGEVNPLVDDITYLPDDISWSSDSTKLAYVNRGSDSVNVVDLETGEEWQISPSYVPEYGSVYQMTWSPDGQHIALAFHGPGEGELGLDTVIVVNINGAESLFMYEAEYLTVPVWVGDTIFYHYFNAIYSIDLLQLNQTEVYVYPLENPLTYGVFYEFDISNDGQIVLTSHNLQTHKRQIYIVNPSTRELSFVTNTGWSDGQVGVAIHPRWACRPPQLSESGA